MAALQLGGQKIINQNISLGDREPSWTSCALNSRGGIITSQTSKCSNNPVWKYSTAWIF